jgi:hypothetical protein
MSTTTEIENLSLSELIDRTRAARKALYEQDAANCKLPDDVDDATKQAGEQRYEALSDDLSILERRTFLCPATNLTELAAKAKFLFEELYPNRTLQPADEMYLNDLGYYVLMQDTERLARRKAA